MALREIFTPEEFFISQNFMCCVKYFPQKQCNGRIFLLSSFEKGTPLNERRPWYDFYRLDNTSYFKECTTMG
jgi:hypothetical protein